MLEHTGHGESAATIRDRWAELIRLSSESQPPRYELAYPSELLKELVEFICGECRTLGMKAWPVDAQNPGGVTYAVNEAWREFRERPATFGDFEQESLRKILAAISGSPDGTAT
jgi:hypothetical protein